MVTMRFMKWFAPADWDIGFQAEILIIGINHLGPKGTF